MKSGCITECLNARIHVSLQKQNHHALGITASHARSPGTPRCSDCPSVLLTVLSFIEAVTESPLQQLLHTCLQLSFHVSAVVSVLSWSPIFQLCEKSQTSPHPTSRQIELDLHRTLTTNRLFCSPSSAAQQQLRRILLAFSWRNPAIGYCQGLNRCSLCTRFCCCTGMLFGSCDL